MSHPTECDDLALLREFTALSRLRAHGAALGSRDLERWGALRDHLEGRLGTVAPRAARRRRALRVRTRLKLLVTTGTAQELTCAHVLSETGLFVGMRRPPAPGSVLQLELRDRRGQPFELEGSVVWVRPEADGQGPPGMGVALHAQSAWDRERMVELVEAALETR